MGNMVNIVPAKCHVFECIIQCIETQMSIHRSTIYTVHVFREWKRRIVSVSVRFFPPLLAILSSATVTELIDRERERERREVDHR